VTAVAGDHLDLALLRTIASQNQVSDLEDWLTVCANAAVLERQDHRWRFAHNKLREGILAELTTAEQQTIHQLIAKSLEVIYPYQEQKAAQLTHHWGRAGNREKEIHYANLAGTQALNVWANHEARLFFEQVIQGLSELEESEERQRLYIDVALKLSRVAAFVPSVDVLAYLQQAREYAEALGDEERQAHVYSSIGAYHYVRVQMGVAFEYFQKCLVLAEKLSLESLLVLPYNLIGRAHANLGNYNQASTLLARGIPLAEQFNDLDLLAGSLVFYGLSLAYQGMWDEAETYTNRAITLAENLNSPERIAANKMIAGVFYAYCGYWEKARVLLAQAETMTQEQGALQLLFVCLGTLGFVCLRTGELEEGCDYLEKCLNLNQKNPQLFINLPMFHAYAAETMLEKEGRQSALEKAEMAIELAVELNQPMAQAQGLQTLARILQAGVEPDWTRAEQALKNAIAIYEKGNGLTYIAICQLEMGKLYAAKGETAEARALLSEAQSLFSQYNLPWYQNQAQKALSELEQ
jgi:tetratricopeptide (TPR) repeat protein